MRWVWGVRRSRVVVAAQMWLVALLLTAIVAAPTVAIAAPTDDPAGESTTSDAPAEEATQAPETAPTPEDADDSLTPSLPGNADEDGGQATDQSAPSPSPETPDIGDTSPPAESPEESPAAPATEEELPAQRSMRGSDSVSPMQAALGCSYADASLSARPGAYANTLCWIDSTGVSTADTADWNRVILSRPASFSIGGGYTFSATMDIRPGNRAGSVVSASRFPTWGSDTSTTGAFLGRKGFYPGVAGQPAIYQRNAGAPITNVTLRDIRVTDDTGARVQDFSLVVADAESTDTGESITWTHSGGAGFRWLPNSPAAWTTATTPNAMKNAAMGNACSGTGTTAVTKQTTSTVTCAGGDNANKTGTAMLQISPDPAANTFSVTQRMAGSGLQGVAFGVVLAGARVNVEVDGRILDSVGAPTAAEFSAQLSSTFGTRTARAPGTATTATSERFFPASLGSGTAVTFSSTNPFPDSYTASWTCSRNTSQSAAPESWPGNGGASPPPSSWSTVAGGEFAECTVRFTAPKITLAKQIAADGTAAPAADASHFDLTLQGSGAGAGTSRATVRGAAANNATALSVGAGTYALGEAVPADRTLAWEYGYSWTDLICRDSRTQALLTPTLTRDGASSAVTGATLPVTRGMNAVCVFENTANQPRLSVGKDVFAADGTTGLGPADPESGDVTGRAVTDDQLLTFRLTFDNREGSAAEVIDHVDHLADVLDDASFVSGSLRYGTAANAAPTATSLANIAASPRDIGANGRPTSASPRLELTGAVPAYQVRTVSFQVRVLSNRTDLLPRQDTVGNEAAPTTGYMLTNYLTPASVLPPAQCEETGSVDVDCTVNPIPAWSMEKTSFPASTARLHAGGNVHYRLAAAVMNEATAIDGLVFSDDLTDVFDTAGWAPEPAVPGGAKTRGIYFLDADGNTLDADGAVNGSAAEPVAAYGTDSGVIPEPQQADGRWVLTTQPVDVPAGAVSAELWFAVQAGQSPVGIPAMDTPPVSGSQFTNAATATAALPPNQCVTGQDNPTSDSFPEQCLVSHELRDNFFTIRKDAAGAGLSGMAADSWDPDPTGLWNLIGHEFELRDEVDGAPSPYPSVKLCREDYDPYAGNGWDGTWIDPAQARATAGDWGEDSQTLAKIRQWNQDNPNPEDQLPLCATLYPIADGDLKGRWRSENLEAGNYWLVETKVPTQQIRTDGSETRPVEGVQLPAEPVAFTVWSDEDGDVIDEGGQAMYGRGQLDVNAPGADFESPQYLDRCVPGYDANTGANIAERPVACVNATGYLLLVKNSAPAQLPLVGGSGTRALTVFGLLTLASAAAGMWWWRRRQAK